MKDVIGVMKYHMGHFFFSLVILAIFWWVFASIAQRGGSANVLAIIVGIGIFQVIAIIVMAVISDKLRLSISQLAMIVLVGLLQLIQIFSVLYWVFGQHRNFNFALSHLDAIYFTLGTLTTAGTGNIVAISETARTIQSVQMATDFGYILLAIGIVVSRLSSSTE